MKNLVKISNKELKIQEVTGQTVKSVNPIIVQPRNATDVTVFLAIMVVLTPTVMPTT